MRIYLNVIDRCTHALQGWGGVTLPNLKWVNGWYQGSPGASTVTLPAVAQPVTYAFWDIAQQRFKIYSCDIPIDPS